jgi:hypothetical protein
VLFQKLNDFLNNPFELLILMTPRRNRDYIFGNFLLLFFDWCFIHLYLIFLSPVFSNFSFIFIMLGYCHFVPSVVILFFVIGQWLEIFNLNTFRLLLGIKELDLGYFFLSNGRTNFTFLLTRFLFSGRKELLALFVIGWIPLLTKLVIVLRRDI